MSYCWMILYSQTSCTRRSAAIPLESPVIFKVCALLNSWSRAKALWKEKCVVAQTHTLTLCSASFRQLQLKCREQRGFYRGERWQQHSSEKLGYKALRVHYKKPRCATDKILLKVTRDLLLLCSVLLSYYLTQKYVSGNLVSEWKME